MSRLSVARDRELRHAHQGNVAWRFTWEGVPYAWCRICGRNATVQIEWLMRNGFIPQVSGTMRTVNVLVDEEKVTEYVRRYR